MTTAFFKLSDHSEVECGGVTMEVPSFEEFLVCMEGTYEEVLVKRMEDEGEFMCEEVDDLEPFDNLDLKSDSCAS